MNRRKKTSQSRQLAVLLALLGPGAGLFLWGIARCASAGPSGAAVALSTVGLCLVLAGGLYHYRTDYRGARGRSLASFLALSALSALAALLAASLLSR